MAESSLEDTRARLCPQNPRYRKSVTPRENGKSYNAALGTPARAEWKRRERRAELREHGALLHLLVLAGERPEDEGGLGTNGGPGATSRETPRQKTRAQSR
ncbi:hypothetical protein KM043_003358 [Ampulex compressa]|nr:hypothetical protein KM043_003358 [Ampulex compressa]